MIEVRFVVNKQVEGSEEQRREIEDRIINEELGPAGFDVEIVKLMGRR